MDMFSISLIEFSERGRSWRLLLSEAVSSDLPLTATRAFTTTSLMVVIIGNSLFIPWLYIKVA
ncbi:MAG: hypothetical protein ACD_80C00103G0002 [uncultured bacterium (gcode 4)]|uniref:Uncharacterized protein n=1 Tax=uncultured bacterium (gcode 4) TaxID=1234023 RepID=K1XJ33_9BACT|nr:MAG: hypothetical protein ACD_80C00103G0002 [uncultured bacterium (gcode 4)]